MLELNLRPDPSAHPADVRIARIDGVICLAVPPRPMPYINRALGFGTIAPGTPELLERIVAHYGALGRETRISVAPGHTTAAAMLLLREVGFRPDPEMPEQLIYLRSGRRVPELPEIAGLRLLRVRTAEDADRRSGVPREVEDDCLRRRARGSRSSGGSRSPTTRRRRAEPRTAGGASHPAKPFATETPIGT